MDTPPIHDLYSVIEKDGVTAQVFGVYWNGKIDVRVRNSGREMTLNLTEQKKWTKIGLKAPLRPQSYVISTYEIQEL